MISDISYKEIDAPLVKSRFEISVQGKGPYISMYFDLYGDKSEKIAILNNLSKGIYKTYQDLKELNEHYCDDFKDLTIEGMYVRCYFDEYGRECEIDSIINDKFPISHKVNDWRRFQINELFKIET
jgi:hypothetical protein